jgi:hypothetical protein
MVNVNVLLGKRGLPFIVVLRGRLVGLRLWLCWWSGFCARAETVLEQHLAKQLLLNV